MFSLEENLFWLGNCFTIFNTKYFFDSRDEKSCPQNSSKGHRLKNRQQNYYYTHAYLLTL